jgi:hypothetical protein
MQLGCTGHGAFLPFFSMDWMQKIVACSIFCLTGVRTGQLKALSMARMEQIKGVTHYNLTH